MIYNDWPQIHTHILVLEQDGFVTRTFRRLDPERQQVILQAILDEAIEKGPLSLNIKQVAKRAGVSIGSLYMYFENRDGLIEFAVELSARYMIDTFRNFKPYLIALPLKEALSIYLMGGLEWSHMQAGLVQFFLRATYQGDPELAERVVRPIAEIMLETLLDILVQAVERGEIRKDIDLEATSRVLHASLIAVGDSQLLPYLNNYLQVTGDEVTPERSFAAFFELVTEGISISN